MAENDDGELVDILESLSMGNENTSSELENYLAYEECLGDYKRYLLNTGDIIEIRVVNSTTYGIAIGRFLEIDEENYQEELIWAYGAANQVITGELSGTELGIAEAKLRVLTDPNIAGDGNFRNRKYLTQTEYRILHPHEQDSELLLAIRGLVNIVALVERAIPTEGKLNPGSFYYSDYDGKWDRKLSTIRHHLRNASKKYALNVTGEIYNHILHRIYDSLLKTNEFPKIEDKIALQRFMHRNFLDFYYISDADDYNFNSK